ncbi:unnamed protein product [Nezara viridula]|uniref:Neuropeptide n=1 Tax=Nezara viridula TaxID=85310 RepID=A0A9P0E4K8_NEZVI|nr:unnamed protein product [Nezara viridula]
MRHIFLLLSYCLCLVDWASLAQQWIKMKEEAPQSEKEQGEAPMDIIKDDNTPTPAPTTIPSPAWPATQIQPAPETANWWSWSQAGTTGSWPMSTPYTALPVADSTVAPTAPTYPYTPAAPSAPETYVPPPPNTFWGNEMRVPSGKEEASSWESRNHKKPVVDTVTEIDAAKRKQLPAWIREGLEKMEREKQKKAENERLERERKEALLKKSLGVPETVAVSQFDGNGYEEPQKSKFESETSDDEADDKEKERGITEEIKPRKSRFDVRQVSPPKPVFRTKEQILQAVMGDVRKILTQILMEVTSEEIEKAVEDVSKYFRKKAPATTVRKTPALTSLTGKLGLGIYESDSDSGESSDEKVTNEPDSDQEIKDRIERLKNEFVQTEKFIERELIEQEEREKRQLLKEKRESSEEREGQVQTLQLSGKKPTKFIITLGSFTEKLLLHLTNILNII